MPKYPFKQQANHNIKENSNKSVLRNKNYEIEKQEMRFYL